MCINDKVAAVFMPNLDDIILPYAIQTPFRKQAF